MDVPDTLNRIRERKPSVSRSGIHQSTQSRSISLSIPAIHYPIGSVNTCGYQPSVNEAMDSFRIFHRFANVDDWYKQTVNDA
ncbi:hypothetical protein TNCV_3313021 [Trichonephila clavipes]|nr:hypothetical protein TNCV_3313021 [Trichonephila clavipes]